MHIVGAVVLFILQLLGACFVAASPQVNFDCIARDNNAAGPDIEVFISSNTPSMEFSCPDYCLQCSWYRLVAGSSPQPIGNGNVLSWNETQLGHGQFNCIRADDTVASKLLILPGGLETCENCLHTESCINTMYFELNFSVVFDEWILNGSSCELCRGHICNPFNSLYHMCIKISQNDFDFVTDHSIRCPICARTNTYYHIPVHDISNNSQACNVEGNCITLHRQSTVVTSTAFSSMIQSSSSTIQSAFESIITSKEVTKVPSVMMTSTVITSVNYSVTSTVTPSATGESSGSDDDDMTGIIVGAVVAGLVVLIVITIILLCIYKWIKNRNQEANNTGSNQNDPTENGQTGHPDLGTLVKLSTSY